MIREITAYISVDTWIITAEIDLLESLSMFGVCSIKKMENTSINSPKETYFVPYVQFLIEFVLNRAFDNANEIVVWILMISRVTYFAGKVSDWSGLFEIF